MSHQRSGNEQRTAGRKTHQALRTAFATIGIGIGIVIGVVGCSADQRPAESIRTSGDRSFQLGAYDEAADEYRAIVDRYPGDWRAQYRLGLCYLELERPVAASRALKVAIDEQPDQELVADALAEAYFQQEDFAQLFAFLRDRAERDQTVEAWLRLGRFAMRSSDPDTAIVAIDTAITLDSNSPDGPTVEPYIAAANLAEELGDNETALRRLRQAYGIESDDPSIRQRLRSLGEVPGPTVALPPGR